MSAFISTDASLLDLNVIHDFLSNSYWAKGIPRATMTKSFEHSLCFGVYSEPERKQIGFARVITDYTVFAYIADVFIVPERQGQGLGKRLIRTILADERLQGLRRWHLVTLDAQGLYKQCGFRLVEHPERHMEIVFADRYLKKSDP